MKAQIKTQLRSIYLAVDYMSSLEDQDQNLVVDMSLAMINDVIRYGHLTDLDGYVSRYCDVIDGDDDVTRIVADITDLTTASPEA